MSGPHVLIIGAGITGLLLAQSLRKHTIASNTKAPISFTVFERDPHPDYRGKGWGLTIHWALDDLLELLPEEIVSRLEEAYVNPEAVRDGEEGQFLFFDLKSAESRWRVPPSKRIRVKREGLRRLLMEGVEVKWNHTFTNYTTDPSSGQVTATFITPSSEFETTTTTHRGSLLIGCDGTRSWVRSALFPNDHTNYILPVRLLGVSVVHPSSLARKARALDPFFYQRGDPETNAFHWFSFLDSPSNNDREGDERESYECQILVSWPYKPGFMGRKEPLEVPEGSEERLKIMKEIAGGWAEPFRGIVMGVTGGDGG